MLVLLLLNEGRHRVVGRLFGVSRADANIVTVVALSSLASAAAAAAARLRSARPHPSIAGAAVGAVVVKEAAHGIAGEWSRTTPLFAGLVTLVALEKSFGPALRGSFRAARGTSNAAVGTIRRARAFVAGQ